MQSCVPYKVKVSDPSMRGPDSDMIRWVTKSQNWAVAIRQLMGKPFLIFDWKRDDLGFFGGIPVYSSICRVKVWMCSWRLMGSNFQSFLPGTPAPVTRSRCRRQNASAPTKHAEKMKSIGKIQMLRIGYGQSHWTMYFGNDEWDGMNMTYICKTKINKISLVTP